MDLCLILSQPVNNVMVDGYYGTKQAWFTREQIGQALEYSNPRIHVAKIHERHRERLDLFSGVVKLSTPSGVQDSYVYNIRGVLEICRWSKQPKADMVMDALYDMAESVVEKGYYTFMSAEDTIKALAKGMEYDHFMEDVVFPAMEMQNEFTFDKIVEHYCGFPVTTMDDFRHAKRIFEETSKERKQRLSAFSHSVLDYAHDDVMYRRISRFRWSACENRGHYQTIKGVRWFDDYILNQLKAADC